MPLPPDDPEPPPAPGPEPDPPPMPAMPAATAPVTERMEWLVRLEAYAVGLRGWVELERGRITAG